MKPTGYELDRAWWDFAYESDQVKPAHHALWNHICHSFNRLGWRDSIGLPSDLSMQAIGVANWRTYNNALTDLEEWGFIRILKKSTNQYTATQIVFGENAIVKNTEAMTESQSEPLTKALLMHGQEHCSHNKTIKQLNHQIDKKEEELSFYLDVLNAWRYELNGSNLSVEDFLDVLIECHYSVDYSNNREYEERCIDMLASCFHYLYEKSEILSCMSDFRQHNNPVTYEEVNSFYWPLSSNYINEYPYLSYFNVVKEDDCDGRDESKLKEWNKNQFIRVCIILSNASETYDHDNSEGELDGMHNVFSDLFETIKPGTKPTSKIKWQLHELRPDIFKPIIKH